MIRPTDGRPVRVLVVDDVADAADTLAYLLGLRGFEVRTAADGPAALRAAAERPPDAVLLDLRMPGMDGWELARRLQSRAGETPPLLVALTGCATEDDRRLSAAAGIDHHLAKPVDVAEFVALLEGAGTDR